MQKPIFIIADIHLSQAHPSITEGFIIFLKKVKQEGAALYILGDLFDAWLGDDVLAKYHEEIAAALLEVSHSMPCYFLAGNRDFLVGKTYAKLAGFELIKSPLTEITHQNKCYILMHGDTLCIDDIQYQRYRKIVHNPFVQWLYRHLPKSLRINFAKKLREKSKATNQVKSQSIMDVNQTAVEHTLRQYDADYLIHGHTHRPQIHKIEHLLNKTAYRLVLGDWQAMGWYIEINQSPKLVQFRIEKNNIQTVKEINIPSSFSS